MYTQTRHTKLGLATIAILQEGDLYETSVKIEYDGVCFRAKGTFSSEQEAHHWAYGVKQATNDDWAGYVSSQGILTESKPPKTRGALSYTIADALKQAQSAFDNFTLRQSSTSRNVSIQSVKTSTLLSAEEKATMEALFVKMGKAVSA